MPQASGGLVELPSTYTASSGLLRLASQPADYPNRGCEQERGDGDGDGDGKKAAEEAREGEGRRILDRGSVTRKEGGDGLYVFPLTRSDQERLAGEQRGWQSMKLTRLLGMCHPCYALQDGRRKTCRRHVDRNFVCVRGRDSKLERRIIALRTYGKNDLVAV
eukprot:766416-Hanusia_phi.AAC.1